MLLIWLSSFSRCDSKWWCAFDSDKNAQKNGISTCISRPPNYQSKCTVLFNLIERSIVYKRICFFFIFRSHNYKRRFINYRWLLMEPLQIFCWSFLKSPNQRKKNGLMHFFMFFITSNSGKKKKQLIGVKRKCLVVLWCCLF